MPIPPFLIGPAAKYIGAPVAIALLAWGGYMAIGSRFTAACERDYQVALAASIIRAQEQARTLALQDFEVLQSGIVEVEKIRTVYRKAEVEIVKYVPTNCMQCSLSPDGLKLLNDALTNSSSEGVQPNTGVTPDTLPRPPTKPDWSFPNDYSSPGTPGRKVL
jgi:hypothetical protein